MIQDLTNDHGRQIYITTALRRMTFLENETDISFFFEFLPRRVMYIVTAFHRWRSCVSNGGMGEVCEISFLLKLISYWLES